MWHSLCVTKLFFPLQNTADTKKEDKDKEYTPTNGNTNYQMSRRSKKAKAEDVRNDLVLFVNTIFILSGHTSRYILVMPCFWGVYHGISHKPCKGLCVFQENAGDPWDIPWFAMRKPLYHAIENTVANTNGAIYVQHMGRLAVKPLIIQWLSCILIGCRSCDMV